jgi:hypothetical protein
MANRQRGEVAFDVAGQTYTLVLDIDAICQLEALFSTPEREMSFSDILQRVQGNSVRHVRGLVWAALRKHHKEVTVTQAGALIDACGGLPGFNDKLAQIAQSTQPDPEDAASAESNGRPHKAQRRRAGTGVNSTSMPAASA